MSHAKQRTDGDNGIASLAPAIPILETGRYLVRDNDTLAVSTMYITLYTTAIEFEGTVMEMAQFTFKYTPIEFIYGTTSSTTVAGNTPTGEDME